MNSLFTNLNPYFFGYMLMYFFWFVAQNRIILFWLYLWQLKEYHIGRFLDHFSTSKGKSLLWNYLVASKLGILIFFALGFRTVFVFLAILLFVFEAALTVRSFLNETLKHPVLTPKTRLLIFATHGLAFLFAISLFSKYLGEMSLPDFSLAALWLIMFDLLAPLFVSAVVLLLQPFTVLGRNRLIAKAKKRRQEFNNLNVVGITGSYGKSSTKELLAHILSSKFRVAKTQANQNSEVGVSLTVLNELKDDTQILIVEMAGYNRGGIKLLCEIAQPRIGIISGINQQHMATFGSQQNIIDGKFELAAALPESGFLVLNWDSEFVRNGYEKFKNAIKTKNIVWCSANEQKDIWASDVQASIENLSLTINHENEMVRVNINARGAHNIQPILLAVAAALSQGITLTETKAALENYDFSQSGIRVYQSKMLGDVKHPQTWGCLTSPEPAGGITILDSTYSANFDGVMAHLDYLRMYPGKKAIVMPCLIELGKSSREIHAAIGKKIAQVCDLAIIVTGDRFGEIKNGAIGAGINAGNVVFLENPITINNLIKNRLISGDTIFLEGRLPQNLIELVRK